MAMVYMTVPHSRVAAQIATELMEDGMPGDRIQVYSARRNLTTPMPVKVTRYRSPGSAMAIGGLIGGAIGALVGLPLLALGGVGIAPLLVLFVAGGLGGAVFRLWIGNGFGREIYHLEDALNRGEGVVVLEVDDGRVGEVESRIKSRHPDVSVLGTDPQGTPPFP